MRRSHFSKSVMVLVGGTAISRAAMVLALPILTRLYTPEDFGTLAVFASVLSIAGVVACLRFEVAIPIPTRSSDAVNLLALGVFATVIVSMIIAVLVMIFPSAITSIEGFSELSGFLWLLPFGVLLFGWYNALQYWATRKKRFSKISKTRVAQGIGGAISQVVLGVMGIGPLGLIVGYLISSSAGVISLVNDTLRNDRKSLRLISVTRMREAMVTFQRFPKYGSFEVLINSIGTQFPMILIAAMAGVAEAGFLLLVTRIIGVPLGMIGAAVGQVFLSQSPKESRKGNAAGITLEVFGRLVKSGVGPLVFAAIVAGPLFTFVFGDNWARAGQLLPWLTPWFVFQFLSSPVSPIMQVMGRQKAMVLVVFLGLVLRVTGVVVGAEVAPSRVPEFFGIFSMAYYAVLFVVVYRVAGVSTRGILGSLGQGFPILLIWVGAAIATRLALGSMSL